MLSKLPKQFTSVLIGLSAAIIFPLPKQVFAITPLTKAQIQKTHNIVQFIPKDNSKQRPAKQSDTMIPGDAVSTGRSSLVDLRFNDGSLARVGEQAIFKFLPKTRDVQLSNGTLLLLIPPGQGQTNLRTPNAAAAIRGSALFVRYNPETNTSIVGALTNSKIEVFDQNASQSYVLEAGQLMVVVEGKFGGLYDFDLKTFYENSNLLKGLNLDNRNSEIPPDPALIGVKEEINQALKSKPPVTGVGVINNPFFARNTNNPNNNQSAFNNNNIGENRQINHQKNSISVESLVNSAKVISEDQPKHGNFDGPGKSDGVPGGGNTNNPGKSDRTPKGGNTNRPGKSDRTPGGGNTNRPGKSDGTPGGGNTNRPGKSDGTPGGGNTNNPGNSRP